jgi:hypothetical protein
MGVRDRGPESDVSGARAEGPWSSLALETIGWKAFQDLCSQVCEEVLRRPVQIYRDAQDGGQDAVFIVEGPNGAVDATVQCKHSADPRRRLKVGDLNDEFDTVAELVAANQADTYFLITSMGVDAAVAVEIRTKLRALGVRKPHVLGREYLVRAIRASARLRALVPQVYGLGDLGAILDQRLIQQTRALLDHWIPKLKLYVPTSAHRKAVRALTEHGIVLLLGNPSTGKSTIGAILSTIASEDADHTVLHLTSPRDFEANWNPADRKRFFWVDDAFGSNAVRDEYVLDWTSAFRKVQAAIGHGNRFVLTSRRHIYEAAKRSLGQRNHPAFLDGRAVVDVGELSSEEKTQILYNHITYGAQTQSWKRSVRDHLDAVASVEGFLPGIAERLGDPAFTKGLGTSERELIRFMKEPREHLIDTINALDEPLRAALILVYVHQGALSSDQGDDEACRAVAELVGESLPRIHERMGELKGSFLRVARVSGKDVWGFAHPTIADALTDILKDRSHMIAALLRGAPIDTIMNGFVCEGADFVLDAPVVPATLNEVLVKRLSACEDSASSNWTLFSFLAHRASDDVVQRLLAVDPEILRRQAWVFYRTGSDPKLRTLARAHQFGLLSDELREDAARRLESSALQDFDLSFFDRKDVLALIPPMDLVSLGIRLRTDLLPNANEQISTTGEEADLSEDPESHFERINDALSTLESLAPSDLSTTELIEEARDAVKAAVADLEERKRAKEKEEEDHSKEWTYMASVSQATRPAAPMPTDRRKRSVFSDVDQ